MKRADYAAFLGTHEWPATPGLFQAICAGIVVADNTGQWVESRSMRPARAYVIGSPVAAPDEEREFLLRDLDVARRAS